MLESPRKRWTDFYFHHSNFAAHAITDLTVPFAQTLKIEPLFSFRYIKTSYGPRFVQIPSSKFIMFISEIFCGP